MAVRAQSICVCMRAPYRTPYRLDPAYLHPSLLTAIFTCFGTQVKALGKRSKDSVTPCPCA